MPGINGMHHVSLTVSDVGRSIAWYGEVLGFKPVKHWQSGDLDKAVLRHPGSGLVIALVGHGAQAVPGAFSERRNGLDHLGFAVTDRGALEEWQQVLTEAGVATSAIASGASGDLLAFRDPDNIALEFYTV